MFSQETLEIAFENTLENLMKNVYANINNEILMNEIKNNVFNGNVDVHEIHAFINYVKEKGGTAPATGYMDRCDEIFSKHNALVA